MSTMTKRSTIYFDPLLHRALRVKAAETSRSVSELINDAARDYLTEDAEDLAVFEERGTESLISYEDMLKRLRADGRI
ncbi:MAG: CopG family transcriptional regulator [Lentisphaeria bacterium]|nr:CopG family transcriptional regulator [Lentisphaeria bacterium]